MDSTLSCSPAPALTVGLICRARAAKGPYRLLLVLALDDDPYSTEPYTEPYTQPYTEPYTQPSTVEGELYTLAHVCLLTNELELAGGEDVLFAAGSGPGRSGLPFALLAQYDLLGTIFARELEPVGLVRGLDELGPAGLPILSRQDGRWQWKLSELQALHGLCAPTLRALLDGER